jgi:hypothetical protein
MIPSRCNCARNYDHSHHQRLRETPMVMRSRATNGGVRPNASKKGQIGPSTIVRAA